MKMSIEKDLMSKANLLRTSSISTLHKLMSKSKSQRNNFRIKGSPWGCALLATISMKAPLPMLGNKLNLSQPTRLIRMKASCLTGIQTQVMKWKNYTKLSHSQPLIKEASKEIASLTAPLSKSTVGIRRLKISIE